MEVLVVFLSRFSLDITAAVVAFVLLSAKQRDDGGGVRF